jgi:hypothetical protein
MSSRDIDKAISALTGPIDYFNHGDSLNDSHETIESTVKKGITLRKLHTELVSIDSTAADGVVVNSSWPSPQSTLTIQSKDISNRDLLVRKNVKLILTVYKRGWFGSASYEYNITPVLPLSVETSRIDEIVEQTLKEDPWKF